MAGSSGLVALDRLVRAARQYKKAAERHTKGPNAQSRSAYDAALENLEALLLSAPLEFIDSILAESADQRLPDLYGLAPKQIVEIVTRE